MSPVRSGTDMFDAAAIDWSDLRTAERMLEETNAFAKPELAEERGVRLRLPSR